LFQNLISELDLKRRLVSGGAQAIVILVQKTTQVHYDGHALRGRRFDERYGYISDEALAVAIDRFTSGHGKTKILVAGS